jgi:hypothetical protein
MATQRQCRDGVKVLRLIQDVSTRWDSTLHMMLRAVLLQEAINKFTTEFTPANIFSISTQEWKHITYLIDVTRQFSFWTSNIGRASGARLGFVLPGYDELFEALEECTRRLKPLQDPWIPKLLKAIDKAVQKLDKYYSKSCKGIGSFYAFGAILSPRLKMEVFNPDYCWLNPNKNWQGHFEGQFRELYTKHYANSERSRQHNDQYSKLDTDPMALLLNRKRSYNSWNQHANQGGEIERYLALRKFIVIIIAITTNYYY